MLGLLYRVVFMPEILDLLYYNQTVWDSTLCAAAWACWAKAPRLKQRKEEIVIGRCIQDGKPVLQLKELSNYKQWQVRLHLQELCWSGTIEQAVWRIQSLLLGLQDKDAISRKEKIDEINQKIQSECWYERHPHLGFFHFGKSHLREDMTQNMAVTR
jgi:hypothetical protein